MALGETTFRVMFELTADALVVLEARQASSSTVSGGWNAVLRRQSDCSQHPRDFHRNSADADSPRKGR